MLRKNTQEQMLKVKLEISIANNLIQNPATEPRLTSSNIYSMSRCPISSPPIARICGCQAGRKRSNPSPSVKMTPAVPLDAALIGPFRSNTEREGGLAFGQS